MMNYDYCYSSSDDEVFIKRRDKKRDCQSPPPIVFDGFPRELLQSTSNRGPSGIFPSPGITPSPRRELNGVIFSVIFCRKPFGEIGLFEPDLSILDWQGFKSYIFSCLNLETNEEFVFSYVGESGEKLTISSEEDYAEAVKLARNRAYDDAKFQLNIDRVSSFPALRAFMSSGMKRVNYSSARSQSSSAAQTKKNVTTSTSFLSFENLSVQDDDTKVLSEEDSLIPSDQEKKTFGQLLLDMEKTTHKASPRKDIALIALDESPSERSSADFDIIPRQDETAQETAPKLRSLLQGQPLPVKVTVYASERSQTPLFCLEKNQSDESDPGIGQSLQYGSGHSSNQSLKKSLPKAPTWFSDYMEKFKEEVSTLISSQIHEELEQLMGRINTQEVEGRIEGILGNYASVVQSKVVCCCKDTSGCTNSGTMGMDGSRTHTNSLPRYHKQREFLRKSDPLWGSNCNDRERSQRSPSSPNNELLEEREKVMAKIERLREFHSPRRQNFSSLRNKSSQKFSTKSIGNCDQSHSKTNFDQKGEETFPSLFASIDQTDIETQLRDLSKMFVQPSCSQEATKVGSSNQGLSSFFFYDASYPDGCEVPPNHTFIKEWIIYNDGSIPWETNVILATESHGDPVPASGRVHVPPLKPNESGVVSILLKVPEKEGMYSAEWSFYHTIKKKFFGDVIWCKVKVVEGIRNPELEGPAQLMRKTSLPNDSRKPHGNYQDMSPMQKYMENGLGQDFPVSLDPIILEQDKFLYNGTDSSNDSSCSDDESVPSSFHASEDERQMEDLVSLYQNSNLALGSNNSIRSQSESESEDNEEDPASEGVEEQSDEPQNDEDITASIADAIEEPDAVDSPNMEAMPKLKKEVSDLHEAFQQRVQVKLDFEALPKSCIQRSSHSQPKLSDPSGNITFDENLFVTQPSQLKPLNPIPYPDTDEEYSISEMIAEKRGLSDNPSRLRPHDDLVSLSSCSSFSDLATADEEELKATITSPITETEETSTTDKCSQASRPASPEISAFQPTELEVSQHPMPSSSHTNGTRHKM